VSNSIPVLSVPSAKQLRKSINNICDSYSHPFDVVTELVQNAVDAIVSYQQTFPEGKQHEIQVTIDVHNRRVEVRDTGIGIEKQDLELLLGPHGTLKDNHAELIGNKGVGLTYTIFVCNQWQLDTRTVNGSVKGEIEGGRAWKVAAPGYSDEPLFELLEETDRGNKAEETGTTISVTGIEQYPDLESDLFSQSKEALKFLLRTRTAIGCTKEEPENIRVFCLHRR